MNRRLALFSILLLLSTQCDADETKFATVGEEISLHADELISYPVWGKIVASASKNNVVINLGTTFQGVVQAGRITLENDLDEQVRLGTISSSCGCTAARSVRQTVDPGQSQPLLMQIRKEANGSFKEGVRFQYAGITRSVELRGNVVPRFKVLGDLTLARDGRGEVMIEFFDERIVPETVRVISLTDGIEVEQKLINARKLKIICTRGSALPSNLSLAVRSSELEYPPLSVPIRYAGVTRVIPNVVHLAKNKPIRVFLAGDTDAFQESGDQSARLRVEPKGRKTEPVFDASVSVEVRTLEGVVSIQFENNLDLEPGVEYVATATFEEESFSFRIRQRD